MKPVRLSAGIAAVAASSTGNFSTMGLFEIIAVLLTLAACFSYLNHHLIGCPTTIGVMVIALAMSLAMLIAHAFFGADIDVHAAAMLQRVDFDQTLLHGMLASSSLCLGRTPQSEDLPSHSHL